MRKGNAISRRRHTLRSGALGFLAGAGTTGAYYRQRLLGVGQAVAKKRPVALRLLRKMKGTQAGRRLLEKGLGTRAGRYLVMRLI